MCNIITSALQSSQCTFAKAQRLVVACTQPELRHSKHRYWTGGILLFLSVCLSRPAKFREGRALLILIILFSRCPPKLSAWFQEQNLVGSSVSRISRQSQPAIVKCEVHSLFTNRFPFPVTLSSYSLHHSVSHQTASCKCNRTGKLTSSECSQEYDFLWCDAVQTGRWVPSFLRNLLPN